MLLAGSLGKRIYKPVRQCGDATAPDRLQEFLTDFGTKVGQQQRLWF